MCRSGRALAQSGYPICDEMSAGDDGWEGSVGAGDSKKKTLGDNLEEFFFAASTFVS